MSDLWDKRIIWVWVGQEGGDGEENLGDGRGWGPLLLQDVQTDGSIGVDVWVINSSGEVNLGWLEWVIGWEVDVQEVNTTGIW